ncbi:MAG: DUF4124 domain-containing protein [Burkholderiales bacterium]
MTATGALLTRSLLCAALLGTASTAFAQIYRWTDEQGRVHLTDRPPPGNAKQVRKSDAAAPGGENDAALPFALQVAAKNFPVTLYTAPSCAPCGLARSLLNSRGVPFREVSVVDQERRQALQAAAGDLSVPSVVVGASVQKGFEAGAYNELLDTAGYPRAGILPPRHQAEPKPAEPKGPTGADATEKAPAPVGPYTPR